MPATWLHQQSLRRAEKQRTRDNVESTLAQLPALYERFLWKDALALLDRADNQLGPYGDSVLRDRVAQARQVFFQPEAGPGFHCTGGAYAIRRRELRPEGGR